ncbi:MAG: hypothetical protein UE295_00285 [Acutalibacteraceae bacterium]|nr:hypothetical protein [Acutalibacteraceae bacterium]
MQDILIAILKFPNDPTNNRVAHQMFLATQTGSTLDLYSVSSILGKERRVFGPNQDDYITIMSPEHLENGFKVPSFIDCTKMYQISISSSVNVSALTQRSLTVELRQRILAKISLKKAEGRHTVYTIKETDFKRWNPKTIS